MLQVCHLEHAAPSIAGERKRESENLSRAFHYFGLEMIGHFAHISLARISHVASPNARGLGKKWRRENEIPEEDPWVVPDLQ